LGKLSFKTRDCKLKIFNISNEEVITGGFCPRGNSEGSGKIKVDYVDIYHRLFEKHFKGIKYQELDNLDNNDKITVGIHRCGVTLGGIGICLERC